MAKAKLLQPSMTAGELSPELYGRVDLARYATALREMPQLDHPPLWRAREPARLPLSCPSLATTASSGTSASSTPPRPATCWCSATTSSASCPMGPRSRHPPRPGWSAIPTRLDQYVTDGGLTYRSLQPANVGHTPASSPLWWVADTGLQITTPWSGVDIWNLRYTQSADVMYFVSGTVKPAHAVAHRLQCVRAGGVREHARVRSWTSTRPGGDGRRLGDAGAGRAVGQCARIHGRACRRPVLPGAREPRQHPAVGGGR